MELLEQIRAAGVVGCGGAGFPTHVKLKGKFEYLLVNGAECEPLLRTDRYIMTHFAPQLVEACTAVCAALEIPHCILGLKAEYHAEIAALEAAIEAANAKMQLHKMTSFYPAGDEQTLIYELTGRVVPPGGLPSAVGCVVDNTATLLAISDALRGVPLTEKYLTVAGDVQSPTVLHVPVGTSFARCIELAGGAKNERWTCVSGGPMMGKVLTMAEAEGAVVTKTTSGILILPSDGYHAQHKQMDTVQMLRKAASVCIQCQSCTQLCPRYLLGHPLQPHKIMRKLAMSHDISAMLDDPDIRRAQLCCECGVCEVIACPMGLQPRTINQLVKQALGAAKLRCDPGEGPWMPNPERELRQIPTSRAAARLGLRDYYHAEILTLLTDTPDEVSIPLRMHIGAPAAPVVSVGERVEQGQLLATCPENALGAAVHASISGTITAVDSRITIRREGAL